MEPERAASSWQIAARVALAAALLAFGSFILQHFFPALAWAAVLAVALWPLYRRLLGLLPRHGERVLGPLVATVAIAVVIIAPLVLLGFALARESHVVIGFISEARHHGVPVPGWIGQLPLVGPTLARWWQAHLSDPYLAQELFGQVNLQILTQSARQYGGEVLHRVVNLLFTILVLFFLFRDGGRLAGQMRELSDRLIGMRGERVARHMIAAVHGTVNGLVLVGLAEGILLGAVYFAVGLPYPASVGAVTAVAAIIPFGAPLIFGLAAVYLFATGKAFGAVVVIAFGSVLLFIADHFIRPVLIGNAARLPFALVLLGILGGLETMGIIGLFLGPAAMAALVALWREWTEPEPVAETIARTARIAPPRPQAGARPRRSRKG